jgi:hypothetical protein
VKKEENYHKAKYKVAGHAAVYSAVGKEDYGEEDVADRDGRKPYTRFEKAEFVADPEGGERNQEHSDNRKNRYQ